MAVKSHPVKFTYDDFLLFPEDGKRHELIDGERFMTPAPSTRHQRISRILLSSLDRYLGRAKKGEVFAAPMDVVLSDVDVVEPDIILVLTAHEAIIHEKNIRGVPDLVVEIISESTRKTDETIKRKLYERHGVGEYWIVDPELETVKVYRPAGGRYVRAAELSLESNDSLATPALPDFRLPLSDIFA